MGYDCFKIFECLDVGGCIFIEKIDTFNISFKSTQNKLHYDTNITCIKVREGKGMGISSVKNLLVFFRF